MNPTRLSRRSLLAAAAPLALRAAPSAHAPIPFGALPSPRQLLWHSLETYAFLHFTVNTFTNKEWGYGDEDPSIFHPTAFDPDSIVSTLASAGMKAVILTCKHHDGFCLWPTKTTNHSVRQSSWQNGRADVVRDISSAARRHGLKFGVYLSPWDRNNPAYATPAYIPIYRAQLTELLTQYGPIAEVWHDGANGGDGYYGGAREKRTIDKLTYYQWPETWALVRRLQPDAVIFSDVGPDLRWVGNERGIAADPCWATYDPTAPNGGPAAPGLVNEKLSPTGTPRGAHWMPAECDVSIRPGWFWHAAETPRVKTPSQLFDLYLDSVGRGAAFLLNVPPDRRGLIDPADAASLRSYGALLARAFSSNLASSARPSASHSLSDRFSPARAIDSNPSTFWAAPSAVTSASFTLTLPAPASVQLIRLREAISLGQRIDSFSLDALTSNAWSPLFSSRAIGACRIVRLDRPVTASAFRLTITNAFAPPTLSEFSLYGPLA